ncbi:MAG: hypothetical protein NZZ41_02595 [Candidatus Dojkabacteria bacterium]|nr:hypothetical protein [Candidatus Dojkabacteria bacterium]
MSKEINAIEKQEINNLDKQIADISSYDVKNMYQLAEIFIKSKAIPPSYNTPEKIIVGIQRAKELGLSPLAGLSNLPMINGIPSPSVHLLVAKARQAGIRFTIVRDAEKIYEPVLDANGEPVIENGKPKMKADLITTIRTSEFVNGRWFDNEISYRWSDAVKAGLADKDNWKKMPVIMMRNRALAIAARFAAPEATLGLLSADEVAEINNIDYVPSETIV